MAESNSVSYLASSMHSVVYFEASSVVLGVLVAILALIEVPLFMI